MPLSNTHLAIIPAVPASPERVVIDNMPADTENVTHKAFMFTDAGGHVEILERDESGQPYFDVPDWELPVEQRVQRQFYWEEYTTSTTTERADANYYPPLH